VTALPTETLHASCVALGANAVLILGPSGSGKSALALQLMAFGCHLVSDDRTVLTCRDSALFASAPAAIRGRIEARGVGILAAETTPAAHVVLAIEMGVAGSDRLPPERYLTLLGCPVPLVHKVESAHFPAAVLQYLKGGRSA
jgi:HPr kinase/phosphorylase